MIKTTLLFILLGIYESLINYNIKQCIETNDNFYFYIAIICSIILVYLFYYALQDIGNLAITNALFEVGSIIMVSFISYVYFKETLQKNEVMGVFMIIIGIYVIKSTFCKNLFN